MLFHNITNSVRKLRPAQRERQRGVDQTEAVTRIVAVAFVLIGQKFFPLREEL